MKRTLWADTAGMPLRTRVFSYALGVATPLTAPLDRMTPEQLAQRRALSPAPRFPSTLVTGRVRNVRSRNLIIPTRDGHQLPARVHLPLTGSGNGHVLVYLHGGGWALGRPLDHESFLTQVVDETGAVVVAPDYRLAPQAKAPQAVLDCIDTVDWVRTGPDTIGRVDSIVVGGDSAGGNLSALVALDARDRGLPLAGQVLIYPATDLHRHHTLRTAPILSGEAMDVYRGLYLNGSGLLDTDPRISPWEAESLTGLAPALVQTAELDPLREEGEEYAARLRDAGVPTRLTRWRGVPHGYMNFPGATHVGYQARAEIVDQLNQWWT